MLAAAEALELAVDGRLDELAVEDALLDVLEAVDADEDSKEVDVDEAVVEVELEVEVEIEEIELELEVDNCEVEELAEDELEHEVPKTKQPRSKARPSLTPPVSIPTNLLRIPSFSIWLTDNGAAKKLQESPARVNATQLASLEQTRAQVALSP